MEASLSSQPTFVQKFAKYLSGVKLSGLDRFVRIATPWPSLLLLYISVSGHERRLLGFL